MAANTTRSADGTRIAFEVSGEGPPVIVVDAALCYREAGPSRSLAGELSRGCTVYIYDRRGRGESGDGSAYAMEREVEDLAALIEHAGGSASLFGASSGGVLALDAAGHGLSIENLALYEPPFIVDDSRAPAVPEYRAQLIELVGDGRRGDAVKMFMKFVGVPGFLVASMPLFPAWRKLKSIAHTLVYDATIMEGTQYGERLPAERWCAIEAPTLVADGGKSPDWLHHASDALSDVLPNAKRVTVPGQTHMVRAKKLAPVLSDFLAPRPTDRRVLRDPL